MRLPRPIRRGIRRYLFPIVEWIWAAGYAVVGRLRPAGPAVRRWTSAGDARVVIVAPHPDDETLGAGGAALLHRQAGDAVTVAVVTDGRGSRAGGLRPDEMARRRASEIRDAAALLGVTDLRRLDLPEGQWEEQNARERLASLLREADVVYAPSCVDFHPEHVKVARVVADLLKPDQTVRIYQIGVPLTASLVNLAADISAVAATKRRALAVFATQADALAPLARQARYQALRYRLPAVEVFWEMSAAAYARIMAEGPHPYRGIRSHPLADPLAALIGRKARRTLRAAAEGKHDTLHF